MTEYLVVFCGDNTQRIYRTDVGKGFVRLNSAGWPFGDHQTFQQATEGWIRLRFRNNLAEAFSEAGWLLGCPRCGNGVLRQSHQVEPPVEVPYRIRCPECGFHVTGVTSDDARMRWNSVPRPQSGSETKETPRERKESD